ncbi:hypothetical protein Tmar_1221 [Thermaerobacter marianensis DSM 12885]|uniref:Uncharacterized protein n=1 Tax=Thermaerobacter marianensis (strain ATCC 700841 / DSM 12885 / JCM 10246 / 7p75a) TaxID=644966 RepID=E6SLA3_THEM7|nr:hypothetical protein Tmar_1221 [Thermaerobacter marianensis DSM 12885]
MVTQPMVPSPRPRPPRLRRRLRHARRPAAPWPGDAWGAAPGVAPLPEPRSQAGFWARFRAELAFVASLKGLWLAVAAGGFVAGFLLGTWFGRALAAAARLQ